MPAGIALSLAGCGGWVDIETKGHDVGGTGTSGSAGDSGGAPTLTDSRYHFRVIAGLPSAGEDVRELDILARSVSDNGELVVGTVAPSVPPLPEIQELADLPPQGLEIMSGDARYFYWTAQDGTRAWEAAHPPQCLSGDGSSIFTYAEPAPGNSTSGILRWTKDSGLQAVADASSSADMALQFCSYDGKRAGGYRGPAGPGVRAWLWSETQWQGQPHVLDDADQVPDGAFGWVSPEGSVSVVTSYGSPNHIYWSQGNAELQLLPQPSENCFAKPASRDGTVVVSFCEESGAWRVYRWTAQSRVFQSMGTLQSLDDGTSSSADGSALVAISENRIMHLQGDVTTFVSTADYMQTMGLSDDGSTVYLQQSGESRRALRWQPGNDLQPLESLPGLPCTELSFPDTRGARIVNGMAVGLSSTSTHADAPACDWSASRAVLWDAQGARDIAAELKEAGVDFQGVTLRRADYVWAGDRIRVMGVGQLSNGALRTWVAELPPRD